LCPEKLDRLTIMAPSWIKHHKDTLEGIDKALSIDDDLDSSETAIKEAN
jgi:hypothetical protein